MNTTINTCQTSQMAGTSGCIPDHEVNVFDQLCKPVRKACDIAPSTQIDAEESVEVGAAGCIPDYEVSCFGQLCRPVRKACDIAPTTQVDAEECIENGAEDQNPLAVLTKEVAANTDTVAVLC